MEKKTTEAVYHIHMYAELRDGETPEQAYERVEGYIRFLEDFEGVSITIHERDTQTF